MKFALVLICCILIPSTISELIENIDELWEKYKVKYSKSYSDPTEDAMRQKLFEENVHKIAYHNVEAALGMHSWEKGFSEFTDWIPKELTSRQGCLLVRDSKMSSLNGSKSNFPHHNLTTENLPKHVDWRKENILTPVKSQGGCGSCWAFAVTGALEAHIALSTGKRTSLSEQNLVDCDEKNSGCNGGSEVTALDYVMENGIDTEESYPYKGKDQKCQFSEDDVGGRCKDYVRLQDSEDDILKAVAKEGPVIASVHASTNGFMDYSKGIFFSDRCNGQVDHAVLIVGYGEKDGMEYWIIKNSWGESWGMNGYMYLQRNAPFMCGIGKDGVYPII